jgi:membrane protease YdiL (CAAX protease family)
MKKHASFFDRHNWSNNRFAWIYAFLILIFTVIFAIALKLSGIYEGVALRSINIFFILIGFILLLWDYRRSKKRDLTYVQAFLLLLRTGIYFCLLFLPMLLVFLSNDQGALYLVESHETFSSDYPVIQLVMSTYMVTVPTVVIAAMTIAYSANFGKKPNPG